jgi:hypothetical protein
MTGCRTREHVTLLIPVHPCDRQKAGVLIGEGRSTLPATPPRYLYLLCGLHSALLLAFAIFVSVCFFLLPLQIGSSVLGSHPLPEPTLFALSKLSIYAGWVGTFTWLTTIANGAASSRSILVSRSCNMTCFDIRPVSGLDMDTYRFKK